MVIFVGPQIATGKKKPSTCMWGFSCQPQQNMKIFTKNKEKLNPYVCVGMIFPTHITAKKLYGKDFSSVYTTEINVSNITKTLWTIDFSANFTVEIYFSKMIIKSP